MRLVLTMLVTTLATGIPTGIALAQQPTQAPPSQAPSQDHAIPWIDDPEVLRSLEIGMTQHGRTPPALLEAESTRSLQILIDRAHQGSTGITPPPGAPAGRIPLDQPAGLRDGEAPRETYVPTR